MALHKLEVDEFYDDSFTLIAIHSPIEDYRLAFFLNSHLGLKLMRCKTDLDFKYFSASYPLFKYDDASQFMSWYLIVNKCVSEVESLQSSGSLFVTHQKTFKTHYLVPEFKSANYFLKIEEDTTQINEATLIKTINQIPKIITAYKVEAQNLKSKNNLIF